MENCFHLNTKKICLFRKTGLKELVDFSCSPEELERILTMLGLEVEKIESARRRTERFVVARSSHKEKHPNADKLSVCTVAVGEGVVNTICLRCANVAASQKVPLRLVVRSFPNGGLRLKSENYAVWNRTV